MGCVAAAAVVALPKRKRESAIQSAVLREVVYLQPNARYSDLCKRLHWYAAESISDALYRLKTEGRIGYRVDEVGKRWVPL